MFLTFFEPFTQLYNCIISKSSGSFSYSRKWGVYQNKVKLNFFHQFDLLKGKIKNHQKLKNLHVLNWMHKQNHTRHPFWKLVPSLIISMPFVGIRQIYFLIFVLWPLFGFNIAVIPTAKSISLSFSYSSIVFHKNTNSKCENRFCCLNVSIRLFSFVSKKVGARSSKNFLTPSTNLLLTPTVIKKCFPCFNQNNYTAVVLIVFVNVSRLLAIENSNPSHLSLRANLFKSVFIKNLSRTLGTSNNFFFWKLKFAPVS